jgi:uncharacterized integral membrane protein
MRKFVTYVIMIPLGLILIAFAVANRHFVTVSFDPFSATDPSLAVSMPLFALIIAVAILGVIAGGCVTWLGQGRWRRAARRHEADVRTARAELAELRAATHAENVRLPALPRRGFYGASGRDKHGATL